MFHKTLTPLTSLVLVAMTIPGGARAEAPLFSKLTPSRTSISVPSSGESFSLRLDLTYTLDAAQRPLNAVEVVQVDPAGVSTTEMVAFNSPAGLSSGVITLPRVFLPGQRTGLWRYTLRLRDADGEFSTSRTVNITHGGAAGYDITSFSPATASPGATLTVNGVGFDARAGASALAIGGVAATITSISATRITAIVPELASSGPLRLSSREGVTLSASPLTITPSITLTPPAHPAVTPSEGVNLLATVRGLASSEIRWYVDGIPGGSADRGFIDGTGRYTAPADLPADLREVHIQAVAAANTSVVADTWLQLVPPLPRLTPVLLSPERGMSIEGEGGLASLTVGVGQLLEEIEAEWLDSFGVLDWEEEDLPPLASRPLLKVELGLAGPPNFVESPELNVTLPLWLKPGTRVSLLVNRGAGWEESEDTLYVGGDGLHASGLVKVGAAVTGWLVHVLPEDLPDLDVIFPYQLQATVKAPPVDIFEGMTVPVLVEGKNFVTMNMRVSVDDPNLAPFVVPSGVVVSPDGKQLGFTVRIHPWAPFLHGQTVGVPFRIQRMLFNNFVFSEVVTSPADFQITGLPELIVTWNNSSPTYTVDGQHIDQLYSGDYSRYSTLQVYEGATLGFGSHVGNVDVDGVGQGDLTCLEAFEQRWGTLPWVPANRREADGCTTGIRIFQPHHRVTNLEVTGPVNIEGTVYVGGMAGGSQAQGGGGQGIARMGGLASGAFSGGMGGAGGVTGANNVPADGQRAGGNATPTWGIGWFGASPTGAPSLTPNTAAGFGSRFDPVTVDYSNFVDAAVTAAGALINPTSAVVVGAKLFALGVEISELSASHNVTSNGRLVSGQGGHGGTWLANSAALVEDPTTGRYLIPNSGGGGGGGGGSSAYTETLFSVNLSTDNRVGGGGAGGGGAAGALRIRGGDGFYVGERARIVATGGDGGLGEWHLSSASPGGGGGGGAGGLLKLQGVRVINAGQMDISGGDRGGAQSLSGDIELPNSYSHTRVQVLGGYRNGAMVRFSRTPAATTNATSPDVQFVWPNGRLRWPVGNGVAPLPGIQGVRGLGWAHHFVNPLAIIPGVPAWLEGMVVIDDRRRVQFVSAIDYFGATSGPQLIGTFIDLASVPALAGFVPTDITQSTVAPYDFFVSGYLGTLGGAVPATGTSQIHQFTAGGTYVRRVFQGTSYYAGQYAGHITDLDAFTDGKLAVFGTLNVGGLKDGMFEVDVVSGVARHLFYRNGDEFSMSVFRGRQKDLIYLDTRLSTVACDGGCAHYERIRVYDRSGVRQTVAAPIHETMGGPGVPGLLRLDGALAGSKQPEVNYDGLSVPGARLSGTPLMFNAPVLGGIGRAADRAIMGEVLVSPRADLPVYGQGASPGTAHELWRSTPTSSPSASPVQADVVGNIQAPGDLKEGYNTLWLQNNQAGSTPDILYRLVLYIKDGEVIPDPWVEP